MSSLSALFYRILAFFTSISVLFSGAFSFAPRSDDFEECKNVIFMIGDGMGANSIAMAEQVLGRELDSFDAFPLQGESKTASATANMTDSAAGGTALATGVRVSLETVGVYPSDVDGKYSYPMNLTELAVSQGKAAGIVTTAKTWDATPAAFSAHVSYRDLADDIHRQQSESELMLLWGEKDSNLDLGYTESCGFEIIRNKAEMDALDGTERSFGQFPAGTWKAETDEKCPDLSEMTAKAIEILDDDEDGFFLMVEAAHIDKHSHSNEKENMSEAVASFDSAIRVALDYAEEHGDTMVLVTADHETGGIIKVRGNYVFTIDNHTSANVPLFVYGCDNFIKQGEELENREIGRRTACVMGEDDFPKEIVLRSRPFC